MIPYSHADSCFTPLFICSYLDMKKVSIIIVTYNSEKDIFDCVSSIMDTSDIPRSEIELIIVDNNSRNPQPMFQKLKDLWGEGIVYIENKDNVGYGKGNNVGIRKSTAPVIMIMNPDVRLVQPIFKPILDSFAKDESLSMCGMKQMLTVSEQSTNSFTCTYMMNGYLRVFLSMLLIRMDRYVPRFMHFSGSCFFVRRSMFEKAGLFDEEVFMYGEEDDIHYRIMKMFGANMRYFPNLRYLHLTKSRVPTLEYEKKKHSVAVSFHQKKGYSPKKTTKQFIRSVRLEILRERMRSLCGKATPRILLLQDFMSYLKDYYNEL